MVRITVARAMLQVLETAGTEYAFVYNGHGNWPFLDSLAHESRIKGILTRAEDHAIEMADGYFRAKLEPPLPVVSTTVGPGNQNALAALPGAFFDSSAMLVIAGGGPSQWLERGGIEEVYRYGPEEWVQMAKPVTKKAVTVTRPDTALDILLRAYKEAVTMRPGPVVVHVPVDIFHSEIEVDSIPQVPQWAYMDNPAPNPDAIKRAAQLIRQAQRPVIVVSNGIRYAQAWTELLQLAEAYSIPVITTYSGKGVFPEDHPLALGCQGRNGSIPAVRAAQESDLVIAIGTRFSDFDTGAWTVYNIPRQTRLIHIDIDIGEIARVYPPEVGIVADARLALEALKAELGSSYDASKTTPWVKRVQRWKEESQPEIERIGRLDTVPVHYARLCHELSEVVNAMDPDSIVYFDASNVLSFAPVFFHTRSRNFGTNIGHWARLGWVVPAVIGAKLAQPQHPAIGVLGDGAFMMRATAMATAVEQGIPCVWIVLNNRTLQIEREGMLRHFEREAFCTFYRKDTGQPWNPDFVLMARSMGVEAAKVERPEQLRPALTRAIEANQPYLVDVEVDTTAKAWRPLWYRYPTRFTDPPRQPAGAVIDYTAGGYVSTKRS